MRRFHHIAAPLAATALSVLTGCHKPEMQRCVDQQNHVVQDVFCKDSGKLVPGSSPGGEVYPTPYYHLYYGGRGSYTTGSTVSAGATAPTPGHTYSPAPSK